ncbi:MAG: hypothetical protein M0P19_04070 [Nevskia sp.]|jgi:hypothetical protein|nr:hypothetical protein [Nevskia sp.]MCK9386577.1 hypothetical protein [Nevskia sp.]
MAAFKEFGNVQIGDDLFQWRVRHWVGAPLPEGGCGGLSISISVDPGRRRELIVEFPFAEFGLSRPRSEPQFQNRLRACIEAALEEGWCANSRGRPWIHLADLPA